MKRSYLIAMMTAVALTLSGAGTRNSCQAVTEKEPFDISSLGIRGDVNNDGMLSVFDLIRYKQYLLDEKTSLSTDYQSDLNSDGKKNVCDCVILQSAVLGKTKIWSPKNMPVMDGSTSAIPLEAGFKARMLGIPYSDAKSIVHHHKTHESFQMLLSGENDMIFSVPISESQQKDADEAGVHLNFTPVAKEGFVFVVNKNNPVDSLTQEQIKGIYSGEITNWSQVGGNDEEIIAYQRNNDSGSQNYMVEFMKDSKLLDAPKDFRLTSMGGLMDAIAVYDNAVNAIGYSVYSYAAQMYENSSDVKFIAVDGVKPSRETMADSTYPLLSNTYILYTDKASKNTLDFAKWAVSDEGQQCVLENGYVPVNEIEYPQNLRSYNSKGTGKEKPADYKPSEKQSEFRRFSLSEFNDNTDYSIDFLKDKNFQNTINNDISNSLKEFTNPDVEITALNGYMSVALTEKKYDVEIGYGNIETAYDKAVVLNYDLINQKRIENFSDLFYKDVNFISTVNDAVASTINLLPSEYIRTDFLGITGSVDKFSIDSLFLDNGNPYLTDDFMLDYDSYYLPDLMITGEYYDMAPLLDDKYSCSDRYCDEWNIINYQDTNGAYRQKVEGSRFHTDKEIEEHEKAYENVYSEGIDIINKDEYDKDLRIIISQSGRYNDQSSLNVLYMNLGKIDGYFGPYMFDPQTGKQIYLSDIIGQEFSAYDDRFTALENIDLESMKAQIIFDWGSDSVYVDLNPDHINMKYIYPLEHSLKLYELEKPLKGEADYNYQNIYGYAASYILEYGPEKKQWPIEGRWHVTAKRKCYSHGSWWYECWDTDDNDFYGWINEYEIQFYN